MNRKLLLLPALSAALLAGCATYGYSSHGGGGYYYGQPGTEYHYYGYPSYYGYGSPYGYGYGYGAPYYWGGSIGYYYVPSWHGGHGHHHGDGHHHGGNDGGGHGNNPPPQGQQPDRPRPPWRDLDRVARPQSAPKMPPPAEAREAGAPRVRTPMPRAESRPVTRIPRVGGGKRDVRRTPEH
jgi:hypothetical protein